MVMCGVLLLGLLAGCALLPDRTPDHAAGQHRAVSTAGRSEHVLAHRPWRHRVPGSPIPAEPDRDPHRGPDPGLERRQLRNRRRVQPGRRAVLVTKPVGGGTAFAILSGPLFEEKAGAILFATNTAALRDIPDISRNLVDSAIDIAGLDVDEPAAGRYAATVDPVMARAVTLFYFHIRNGSNYPPKQILAGTVSLQRNGAVITGEIALEGADFVGGARPVNRYLATLSSR